MRFADHVDFVIGVDTHKLSHTLGLVSAGGVELDDVTFATDAFGYRKMFAWTEADGRSRPPMLGDRGNRQLRSRPHHLPSRAGRVGRGDRPTKATGEAQRGKVRRARRCTGPPERPWLVRTWLNPDAEESERRSVSCCARGREPFGLARGPCAISRPSSSNAPTQLRDQLRHDPVDIQVERCARLRICAEHSIEHRSTVRALRATARRIQVLSAEADDLEAELGLLVAEHASRTPCRAGRGDDLSGADHQRLVACRPDPIGSSVCHAVRHPHPSPPRRVRSCVTGSTGAATANSTERYTRSSCHACVSTTRPRPTWLAEALKASRLGRSSAV